nr:SpoIIE family protein phosphatase [Streptomyces sp. RPA4-2]
MHRTPLVPRRTGTAAPSVRAAFITLLIAVVVVAGARLVLAAAGMQVMGMAEYSTLIPVVAAALLPLRQTLIVGLANLVVAILAYGILLPSMSHASRITVVTALVASILVSLAVCRARIAAERSLKGLMVARERLTLLSEASTRVGGTLDVARTAEELAEVAVRRFADQAAVDLFDPVLKGEEPARGPHAGPVTLRRAARRSVPRSQPPHRPTAVPSPTAGVRCRTLSLLRGVPMHGQFTDAADGEECWPADPNGTGTQAPHSTLAVPLRARGVTLGAALFTRSRHRDPFDADDVLLAQEIAARAAVCVDNARRYTHERATSVALQRSLLPQAVPPQPAVQAVARYLPADIEAGVGGDWYDVIPLSGARVALVVGDVVGHGIRASAAMGRLRTAVRTLADIDLPPDELLTHLDDIVIRLQSETAPTPAGSGEDAVADADVGEFVATCLYMVYDPISRRCTAARANHPRRPWCAPGRAPASSTSRPVPRWAWAACPSRPPRSSCLRAVSSLCTPTASSNLPATAWTNASSACSKSCPSRSPRCRRPATTYWTCWSTTAPATTAPATTSPSSSPAPGPWTTGTPSPGSCWTTSPRSPAPAIWPRCRWLAGGCRRRRSSRNS